MTYLWSESKGVFFFYLGIPLTKYERTISIEVDIYNTGGILIKSYSASGYSREYCAMYWGYSLLGSVHPNNTHSVCRASNSSAFLDAFQKIKRDIAKDSVLITEALSN